MYWINLLLFFGYTTFWFYCLDNPLEIFIKNVILSYKNLSMDDFMISLRMAFIFFLFNVVMKIRKNYRSFKTFMSTKPPVDDSNVTKLTEDRYKIDFVVEKSKYSMIIQKSPEYNNIEGIYTDDYEDCLTEQVKPYLYFCQDIVYPRDINKINGIDNNCLIITYKNTDKRTFITDTKIYTEESTDDIVDDIVDVEKVESTDDRVDDIVDDEKVENTDDIVDVEKVESRVFSTAL